MKFLTSITLLCVMALTSCCSAKKTKADNTVTETPTEANKMMLDDGYLMGEIVASKAANDCPYVIKSETEDGMVLYDPINLDEAFKKGGIQVWYKFNPLRMMNRCEKANPVSLVDIKPHK